VLLRGVDAFYRNAVAVAFLSTAASDALGRRRRSALQRSWLLWLRHAVDGAHGLRRARRHRRLRRGLREIRLDGSASKHRSLLFSRALGRFLHQSTIKAWGMWVESVDEARRKAAMHSRALARIFHQSTTKAWIAWVESVDEARKSMALHSRALARIFEQSMGRAWLSWVEATEEARRQAQALARLCYQSTSKALATWVEAMDEAKRNKTLRSRALGRIFHQSMGRVLNTWVKVAEEARQKTTLRSRALGCFFHQSMCRAWGTCVESSDEARRKAELHSRTLGHILHQPMGRAWLSWVEATQEARRQAQALVHLFHQSTSKALATWVEATDEARHSKTLRSRALGRVFHQSMCRAWGAWVESSDVARRKVAVHSRALARIFQQSMGRAWLSWVEATEEARRRAKALVRFIHQSTSRALATWVESTDEARRKAALHSRALARIFHRSTSEALATWVESTGEARHNKTLRSGALARIVHQSIGNAWSTWVESTNEARRKAALHSRALGRIFQQSMGRAWLSWVESTDEARRKAALYSRMLARICHRSTSKAWNTWVESTDEARRKAALRSRALGRVSHQSMGRAWLSWVESTDEARRKAALRSRALGRVFHQSMGNAWGAWVESTDEARRKAALHSRALGRIFHRSTSKAWLAWCDTVGVQRDATTLASRALLQWTGNAQRTAFRTWLDASKKQQLSGAFSLLRTHARRVVLYPCISLLYPYFNYTQARARSPVYRSLHVTCALSNYRLSPRVRRRRVTSFGHSALGLASFARRSLRRSVNSWRHQSETRAAGLQLVRRALLAWGGRALRRALFSLDEHARTRLRAAAALRRLRHIGSSRALLSWREVAGGRASLCRRAHGALASWRSSVLRRCLTTLQHHAHSSSRFQRVGSGALARLARRHLSRAYNALRDIGDEARICRKVLSAWRSREMRCAFSSLQFNWASRARLASVLSGALALLFSASLSHGFNAWCQRDETFSVARRALGHWGRRELARAWDTLATYGAARARLVASTSAALSRIVHGATGRCLRTWQEAAVSAAHFQRVGSGALVRLAQRCLSRSFESWLLHRDEEARICLKLLSAWRSLEVRCAFSSLQSNRTSRARLVSVLSGALARLFSALLSRAFNALRDIGDEARICRRVLSAWRSREMRCAFSSLQSNRTSRARLASVLSGALALLFSASLSHGFNTWCQRDETFSVAQRALGHWGRRGVARAWDTLASHSAARTRLVATASAALSRIVHLATGRCLRNWQEAVEARRATLGLARTALASWRAGDLRRALDSWELAATRRQLLAAAVTHAVRCWRNASLARFWRALQGLVVRLSSLGPEQMRALLASRGVPVREGATPADLLALAHAVGITTLTPAELAKITPTPVARLADGQLAALLDARGVIVREGATRAELLAAAAAAGILSVSPAELAKISPTAVNDLTDGQLAALLAARGVFVRDGATRAELLAAAAAAGIPSVLPAELAKLNPTAVGDLMDGQLAALLAARGVFVRESATRAELLAAAAAAGIPSVLPAELANLNPTAVGDLTYEQLAVLLTARGVSFSAYASRSQLESTAALHGLRSVTPQELAQLEPRLPGWALLEPASLPPPTPHGRAAMSIEAQRWLDETMRAADLRFSTPAPALGRSFSSVGSQSSSRPSSPIRCSWDPAMAAPSPGGSCMSVGQPSLASTDPLECLQHFLDERKWTVRELFRNGAVNTSQFTDGKFSLSPAELQAFFASPQVGLPLTNGQAKALVRAIDASGNGEVELLEMDDALRARKYQAHRWAQV